MAQDKVQKLIQQAAKLNYLEQLHLLELLQEVVRKNHPVARLAKLQANREEIFKIAAKYGILNIRVFGLGMQPETEGSNEVVFIVDVEPKRGIFAQANFLLDLQELLGFKDVYLAANEKSIRKPFRKEMLETAVPL
jgi:predicted nucleotidyltransferase